MAIKNIAPKIKLKTPSHEPHGMDTGALVSLAVAFYVDDEIHGGRKQARAIPERRPYDKQMAALGLAEKETKEEAIGEMIKSSRKLLYCKRCGYVVFSDDPPYVCPICKAKREMFEEIVTVSGHYTRKVE